MDEWMHRSVCLSLYLSICLIYQTFPGPNSGRAPVLVARDTETMTLFSRIPESTKGNRQGLENCALQCDRQRYVPDVEGAPTRCLEGAGDGFLEEISDLCLKGRATFS